MNLHTLISGEAYTQVNKILARGIGFTTAGYFCELLSQRERFCKNPEEEEFYFSQSQMEKEIGITEYEQRIALKKLVELGFVSVKKKGIPAKYFYTINDSISLEWLKIQSSKKGSTSGGKSEALVVENLEDKIINKQEIKQELIDTQESTNTLADSIPPVNVKEYIEPSLDKDVSSSITPVNVKKINSGEAEEVCNYYKTQFLKKKGHNNKLATQRINTLLEKYTKQEIINAVDEYKKSKKETIQKDEWQFIKTTDTFFGFEKGTKIHFIERFITQEKKADIKQAKPTTTVIDHNWLNDF